MPKKTLLTLSLFLIALLGVHSAALAGVQIGVGTQITNDQSEPTADLNWWITDHWALRADYSWNNEELGAAVLYKINPGSKKTAVYVGLAEHDLSGKTAPDLTAEQKGAIVAGAEFDLSKIQSGLSLGVEAGFNPNEPPAKPGEDNRFGPRVGIFLHYRFPSLKGSKIENKDSLVLLAKLITLEAPDEPFEGQVAVAAVVINRTHHPAFPGSVPEVIYERGQFVTAPRLAKTVPGESALRAAKKALQGSDPSHGALYFYNPVLSSAKTRRYIQTHFQVTARIGNHVFLK